MLHLGGSSCHIANSWRTELVYLTSLVGPFMLTLQHEHSSHLSISIVLDPQQDCTIMSSTSKSPRPWTKKETILHQADAIKRIDSCFSECVTNAIIELIQKHYTSSRISTNTLFQHAMAELTEPEAEVRMPEVLAMRCMNGGIDPAVWSDRCDERGLMPYVQREVELLRRGLCICHQGSKTGAGGVILGGCPRSLHDRESAQELWRDDKLLRRDVHS